MRSPLVVTDRGSAELPFVGRLLETLHSAGLAPSLYANISPNPRDDEIAAGCTQYRTNAHDGVIAIGGGSGMDGGKAIALTANNDINLWDFEFEQTPPKIAPDQPFPPLICIPTTAGTGAETESTAMITDTVRQMKWCVWHTDLKPALALLDPEITLALPPHLTAWTGVDSMVHAIEAYSVPGFHPLCDAMALEGLRLTSHWITTAFENPENIEARGGMLVGSCLSGIAFLKGLGLVHAISHMIGAEFDTQHGLTNAVLLPAALEFNRDSIADKVPAMAQAMGLADTSFDAFCGHICTTLDRLDIPKTLQDINVPADCASTIASKALQDSAAATNPAPLTQNSLEMVIEQALKIGR